jgi:two-component system response regulator
MNTVHDILLVEDSQNDIDLALYALREENLANNIFIVRDGKEALDFLFCRGSFAERCFNHPPKLVLLDLKLPRVDGLQVLKELKNDPRTKSIPVVIMTSSSEERDLVEGYNLGVNSYIQKPVDCEEKYRMLLDEIQDYAIFMLDPQGMVVSWNAGAERIKGYRGEQIIGHNFSCFFPPEDIKRGRPEEVLRMATASGRHE